MPLEGFPTHDGVFPILHTHVSNSTCWNMLVHPTSSHPAVIFHVAGWQIHHERIGHHFQPRGCWLTGRETPSCQFTLGEYFPVNKHSWLKIHLFQLLWTTSINHSKSLSMRHPNQSVKKLQKKNPSNYLCLLVIMPASFSKHLVCKFTNNDPHHWSPSSSTRTIWICSCLRGG